MHCQSQKNDPAPGNNCSGAPLLLGDERTFVRRRDCRQHERKAHSRSCQASQPLALLSKREELAEVYDEVFSRQKKRQGTNHNGEGVGGARRACCVTPDLSYDY